VTFVRQGESGPAGGVYTGTISPDGLSIRGTTSWYQPGWLWTAHMMGHAQPDGGEPPHGRHGDYAQTETPLADNWNTAGCGFTDTATLDVSAPTRLTRIALWYNWAAGERGVRYTISSRQGQLGGRALIRGSCDPYQGAWCEARDTPNVDLAPGRYRFQVERGALCQNGGSGGQGFIRAWGLGRGAVSVEQESHAVVSLAGTWSANDGGTYVIRQEGDRISWTGTSGDGGRSFINDFQGRIVGDQILGHFEDRPGAAVYSRGDLVLRVEGPNRFVMVSPSGGFGGSVWTR
jgi:hypothetical protein